MVRFILGIIIMLPILKEEEKFEEYSAQKLMEPL